jgi:hypothetical protein
MVCLALFGAALMLLAAGPSLPVLILLMLPLGVPLSSWLGSLSASVQRAIPAACATEAFNRALLQSGRLGQEAEPVSPTRRAGRESSHTRA